MFVGGILGSSEMQCEAAVLPGRAANDLRWSPAAIQG